MRKKLKISIIILIIVVVLIVIVIERDVIRKTENFMFYLEEKYYGDSVFIQVGAEELQALIDSKESFSIFIHQDFCSTSYEFNKILTKFAAEHKITYYKINFEDMQKSDLGKKIEYYPSFAIYNNGNLVDFLRADKDENLKYYKDVAEFEKWFSSYVLIDNINYSEE